jgi:hypothetical protein
MPEALAAGQLVDDRYALEEALDEDALGTVWRAFDRGLGRHVSVRDVAFAGEGWRDDDNQRRQALTAARTAIRLDHPGAVHVYDAFLDDDRLVVVTELVNARPLSSVVTHKRPLPAKRVAAIGLELLDPLAAAHRIGLVHGAITPSAVLLGDHNRVLLTGFGLAPPFLDATSTAWAVRVGTPACVAPEQARHRGNSAASDLWSLGATLYFAVEGRYPFEGDTPEDVLDAVLEGTRRPATRAGKLAPLLDQLLHEDPAARPDADEIRRQLAEVAGVPLTTAAPRDEPAAEDPGREAPPAPAIRRRRRFGRRGADTEAAVPPADGDASSETEGDEEGTVGALEDRDWQHAVVADRDEGERRWREWTPEDSAADGADPWLVGADGPATVGDAPGTPDASSGVPVLPGTTGAPVSDTPPADHDAPDSVPAGAAATPPEERRYRSTPSWPPPQRRRWGVAILCSLVVVVMVALLITNGRPAHNASRTSARQAAQQRPVLSTNAADVPSNWITYRNAAVDFGTAYPPGWSVQEEGQVVTIRDPVSGSQLRIDYSTPPGQDPVQSWTDLERSFSAQHPDYTRLQLSPATYLGHTAALWEFTYTDGNVRVHAVDLGLLTKKYRFTLFFEAGADSWQSLLPTFRGFLSSFQAPK